MADTKISAMTAASSVADADVVPVVQGGANKKAAASLFVTLARITAALGFSAANAAALNATALTSGTVPDARFPATLPAASGANLTNLDATDLTGTIDSARLPTVPYTKGGTGLTTLGTANQVLQTNAGATAVEWATPAGGGTIDGSGAAGRGARWTDTDTLAAGGVQDDGTRAGVGAAPAAAATLTVKAQTGDTACLRLEGTGGVIIPTVLLKHSSDVNGVAIKGDDTGFQFANGGEGTTLYVVPGYPEAYVKTHGNSAGRLNFQSHDGGSYVTVFALKNGKAQLWDGSALVDVSIGAADSAGTGFRTVRVPN